MRDVRRRRGIRKVSLSSRDMHIMCAFSLAGKACMHTGLTLPSPIHHFTLHGHTKFICTAK